MMVLGEHMSVLSECRSRVTWRIKKALALIVTTGALMSSAAAEPGPCSGLSGDDEGMAVCTKAIDAGTLHGRDLAAAYVARGRVYYDRIDLNRALADFDRAIDADASYAPAYDGRGLFFRFYPAQAVKEFGEAIGLDPNNAAYRTHRAAAYLAARDFDHALADANEAIRLEASNAAAYRVRGNTYRANRDLDRAIADLSDAIRLAPDNKYAYFDRGAAYQAKGDLDRALSDYDQTIKLGAFTHAYAVRAGVLMQKGERADAIRDYDEAIRRSSDMTDSPEAYRGRAAAREADGDAAGAAADRAQAHRLTTIVGVSIPTFTAVHGAIAVIAILAGLVVAIGMLGAGHVSRVTALFFAATILTSVSGFMFHGISAGRPYQAGVVSLTAVAVALLARYVGRLAGHWRWVYVIAVLAALYLNVYVAVMQSIFTVAPVLLLLWRQAELAIQLGVIALFLVLCVVALRTYRPQCATPASVPSS